MYVCVCVCNVIACLTLILALTSGCVCLYGLIEI